MSAIIKHLVPSKTLGYRRFIDDKKSLLAALIKKYNDLSSYSSANFSPYPILVSDKIIKQVFHLHCLLIEAIKKVVKNYLADKDIQALVNLPDKAIRLLQLADNKDYEIGAIRPDFLIDKTGSIKICEINARFPVNGFIMSQRLSEVAFHQKFGDGVEPINENKRIITLVSNFFDLTKPITIVKDKEGAYDIHLLRSD